MSVIDRRPQQLNDIQVRMRSAPSFGAYLQLQHEHSKIQGELAPELTAMDRVARGWVFVPPRVR